MPFYFDQGGTDRFSLQDFEPSTGSKYKAVIDESLVESYGRVGYDWFKMSRMNDPKLSAAEVADAIQASGLDVKLTPKDDEYSAGQLNVILDRQRERKIISDIRDRTPWDWGSPLRGAVMFGTAFADPINIATAFIPWARVMTMASRTNALAVPVSSMRALEAAAQSQSALTRFGGRFGVGAAYAGAETAALEPLYAFARRDLGDDYDASDSMLNIGLGAAFGGGVLGIGGYGVDAFRRATGRAQPFDRFTGLSNDDIQLVQALDRELATGQMSESALRITLESYSPEMRKAAGFPDFEPTTRVAGEARKQSPMSARVVESDNVLTATSAAGYVEGTIAGNVFKMQEASVLSGMQGRGFGTALYERLINAAIDRGLQAESGTLVSKPAARVYDALEKQGFTIERNPNAKEMPADALFPEGAIIAPDGEPVFRVTRNADYKKPEDRAKDIVERIDPETRENAFHVGLGQLVDGREIDVASTINTDPQSGGMSTQADLEKAARTNAMPEAIIAADFDASAKIESDNQQSQSWNGVKDVEQSLAEADALLDQTIKAGDQAFKYSRGKTAPLPDGIGSLGFYSALQRGVAAIESKASTPEGWKSAVKGLVNKGLVKQDEIEWTGLNEWLDLQSGKVTKEQINEFLQNNGVKIEEVKLVDEAEFPYQTPEQWQRAIDNAERAGNFALSDRINAAWETFEGLGKPGTTKYGGYTLPGGTNYRELLLTLPFQERDIPEGYQVSKIEYDDGTSRFFVETPTTRSSAYKTEEEAQTELQRMIKGLKGFREDITSFRSSHWDQPNVLTHIRINDRVDTTGAKVLFVEELQSDWAQEGRKKGFITADAKAKQAEIDIQIEEVRAQRRIIDNKKFDIQSSDPNWMFDEKWLELDSQSNVLSTKIADLRNKALEQGVIQPAPFIQDTKSWLSLSLKRVMNYAVENGYDKVAFVNGKQSADRYDLSKQVKSIEWSGYDSRGATKIVTIYPTGGNAIELPIDADGLVVKTAGTQFDGKPIDEIVGKEIAKQIIEQRGGELSGSGLSVGGEGMISFYDKIVPNVTKDLLKKFGGEGIEPVTMKSDAGYEVVLPNGKVVKTTDNLLSAEATARSFDGAVVKEIVDPPQLGFKITDKMRETVSGGLPLFARGAYLGTAENLQQAIADSFGKSTKALLDSGQIVIVNKVSDLPKGRLPHAADTKAATAPDGTVYMVAENISQGEVKGLVLHEVGVHVGMEKMLGTEVFNDVLKQLDQAILDQKPWAQTARDAVPSETRPEHVREEQLAYLVQNYPDLPLVQRIIAAIKTWFYKNFETARELFTLNEADFRSLAVSALQFAARQADEAQVLAGNYRYSRGSTLDTSTVKSELSEIDARVARAKSFATVLRAAAEKLDNDAAAVQAMKAAMPNITDTEIDELLIELKTQVKNLRGMARSSREALLAGDQVSALQDEALIAADTLANNKLFNAVLERRNASLNLAARLKAMSFVNQFRDDALNPAEGFFALLAGTLRVREAGRVSIDAEAKGFRGEMMGGLIADVEKTGLMREFISGAFDRDIYDALWRMGQDKPDMTGVSPQAQQLAQIVNKYQEYARNKRNRFGAWIRDLQGYITRQTHDMYKIREASEDEWVGFVKDRLDLPKMMRLGLISETDPIGSLRELYAEFASGSHMKNIPGEEDTIALGKGSNLAKRESVSRALYFKDGLSAFEYNTQFGSGTLAESVQMGLERAASSIALLKTLGTNPEATLTRLMDEFESSLVGERRHQFRQQRGAILNMLAQVDGSVNIPGSVSAAKIGATLRGWQSMARLGGALISSTTDLAGYAAELRYAQGKNLFSGVLDGIVGLTQGRATGERADILISMGVFHESMAGAISARFDNPDLVGGKMAAGMRHFFRLNGLTWWTETLRDAAALQHSSYMATQSGKKLADINPELRRLFGLYGIDEGKWDIIRLSKVVADGKEYIAPDGLKTIPREMLENYITSVGRTVNDAAVQNLRDDLAQTMRVMFVDRAHFAVLEPGARTRAFMTRGTKPGTVPGEFLRYIGQFKSFSIAMTQMVLGREIYGRGYDSLGQYLRKGKGDMLGLAAMIGMYGALGYAAMSIKDLIKGREPRDLVDKETGMPNVKTIGAALAQGGGLGLYGDFLFGEYSRFGRSFTSSSVGPVLGNLDTLTDLWTRMRNGDDLAASSFKALLDNTPFLNLYWLRPLLDYSILFNIQESLNPGFLRRTEQRIERENSQQFLIKPSEVVR